MANVDVRQVCGLTRGSVYFMRHPSTAVMRSGFRNHDSEPCHRGSVLGLYFTAGCSGINSQTNSYATLTEARRAGAG